jgi:predicted lipoprotein with Yx(FWY)xxD motif
VRRTSMLALVGIAVAVAGCGSSEGTSPSSTSTASKAASVATTTSSANSSPNLLHQGQAATPPTSSATNTTASPAPKAVQRQPARLPTASATNTAASPAPRAVQRQPARPPTASATKTTASPAPKAVSVSVRTLPNVGAVLVNAAGHTLYTFAPDKHSRVTCLSSCEAVWPPFKLASGETAAGSPQLQASLLGSDSDPEGGRVVTYAGWPLYTYAGDGAAGQDSGQAIETNGGRWYVIAPSGKVITTN